MGMSASQARLLTLTSRLHDVELRAQQIEAQKIALATQKDGLYQEYCDALEATAYKVNIGTAGNKNLIDANFNSVCGYYEGKTKSYALLDNKTNKILVNKDTADKYRQYGNDKYAFAFAMMGILPADTDFADIGKISPISDPVQGGDVVSGYEIKRIMSGTEEQIYNNLIAEDPDKYATLKAKHDAIPQDPNVPEGVSPYYVTADEGAAKLQKACQEFRDELMKCAANLIFEALEQGYTTISSSKEWDKAEFQHYVRLWEAIEDAGGCTEIPPQYECGDEGTKWFKAAVESGEVTIRAYGENGHAGEWSDTSFATSTNNNFLQEVNDETNLKKAEAKYEHELNIINKKDTRFDTELSKLETERTAITTEMDSIKKVKDDNIDRTFGIFS